MIDIHDELKEIQTTYYKMEDKSKIWITQSISFSEFFWRLWNWSSLCDLLQKLKLSLTLLTFNFNVDRLIITIDVLIFFFFIVEYLEKQGLSIISIVNTISVYIVIEIYYSIPSTKYKKVLSLFVNIYLIVPLFISILTRRL